MEADREGSERGVNDQILAQATYASIAKVGDGYELRRIKQSIILEDRELEVYDIYGTLHAQAGIGPEERATTRLLNLFAPFPLNSLLLTCAQLNKTRPIPSSSNRNRSEEDRRYYHGGRHRVCHLPERTSRCRLSSLSSPLHMLQLRSALQRTEQYLSRLPKQSRLHAAIENTRTGLVIHNPNKELNTARFLHPSKKNLPILVE